MDTQTHAAMVGLDDARERLRVAYMTIQNAKRKGISAFQHGKGPLWLLWDAINAIPAALYHLDKMPEFEADVAAETMQAELAQARAEIARKDNAMRDALAGWQYIRQHHGDLYGVGWDRVEAGLVAALKDTTK